MDELIKKHKQLMRLLSIDIGGDEAALRRYLLSAVIGLAVESSEALDEFNRQARPWKPELSEKMTYDLIIQETIDAIFYALEIFILLGFSGEDIRRFYLEKWAFNLMRIYAKVDEDRRQAIRTLLKEEGFVITKKARAGEKPLAVYGWLKLWRL